MLPRNELKERLRRGETLAGVFVNLFSPDLVELLGVLGVDFVVFDGEHTGLAPDQAVELYRAAELRRLAYVTRIGVNHPQVLQQHLESGALNVLLPLVRDGEDARRVVAAVKYPPLGRRGLAASRVSDWGFSQPLYEYVEWANRETLVAVQIETPDALRNFDDILQVEGVDVLFFGPSDLSVALGVPGQPTHPKVVDLIERLGEETLRAGKWAGTIARTPSEVTHWKERGFQWLCTGIAHLLADGVQRYVQPFLRTPRIAET